MQIRRPIAALFTALALFGGGLTTTACQGAGEGQSDGTTDSGNPGSESQKSLPDNSDPEPNSEDSNDDSQDPD